MAVDGAEEDGVENRVEAPAWVPDGGSDDAAADQDEDGQLGATPETEGTDSVTAPSHDAEPARAPAPEGQPNPTANGGPQYGNGTSPPSLMSPAPPSQGPSATLANAADAVRTGTAISSPRQEARDMNMHKF